MSRDQCFLVGGRSHSYSHQTLKRHSFSYCTFFELMNVSSYVESGETWHRDPSYDSFHTQRTYRQAQLTLVVLPRKAVDFHESFANVRGNVYRLLLRSLRNL